jgi:hypothetical protein
MLTELFAKDGLQLDEAALREANARWIDEHFGRDFIAWMADIDGRPLYESMGFREGDYLQLTPD